MISHILGDFDNDFIDPILFFLSISALHTRIARLVLPSSFNHVAKLKRALQHHDVAVATEKQHVATDDARQLSLGITDVEHVDVCIT